MEIEMQRPQSHRLLAALAAAVVVSAALSACAPRASEGQSQVVEGLKLDYGLVADQTVADHPTDHPETTMHGGAPKDSHGYHVVLSVADAHSGQRVTDAEVSMDLSGPGHPGVNTSPMDPMTVNGQQTYGHYVVLPSDGPYQLKFEVRRPGQHRPVAAHFTLRRPA
jgi:hypothetical protein